MQDPVDWVRQALWQMFVMTMASLGLVVYFSRSCG